LIRGGRHTLLTVFASILLASCATSDSDVPFGFATADIAPQAANQTDATASSADTQGAVTETVSAFVIEEGDPILPESVVSAPELRPGSEIVAAAPVAASIETASAQVAVAEQAAPGQQAAVAAEPEQTAEAPMQVASLVPEQPKKRGFLSAFFSPATPAAAQPKTARPLIDPTETQPVTASAATPAQPLIQLAATGEAARPLIAQQPAGNANPLPGVRQGQGTLFEISRRSGMDDDSDIDLHEGDEPPYQVASAAGLARLAPNGLMKQTDHVDVACLKPSLVRVLKAVEKNYGRKVIVTSGYRTPDKNRRARGARNSLHMYCAAADVQVEGVSKWDLAAYIRTMPGRGGVGTYCHTESVHIDVGPERDWNWRCRRRK
jgi:uncharacterized protein YcbK (DUF882 family)